MCGRISLRQNRIRIMKILTFDQSKCDGCGACQALCSLAKTGAVRPSEARIRLKRADDVLRAVYCQHCTEPVCVTACMRGIISKDPETDLVTRKTEDCFRCAACAVMCPVGAVVLDHKENAFVTCDLCGGDPLCVKVCHTGALQYEDVAAAIEEKRSRYAQMVLAGEGGSL